MEPPSACNFRSSGCLCCVVQVLTTIHKAGVVPYQIESYTAWLLCVCVSLHGYVYKWGPDVRTDGGKKAVVTSHANGDSCQRCQGCGVNVFLVEYVLGNTFGVLTVCGLKPSVEAAGHWDLLQAD